MPPSFSVSVGEPVTSTFSLVVSEITTVLPALMSFELAVAVAPVMLGAMVSILSPSAALAGSVVVKALPARSVIETPVGRLTFVTVSADVFWPAATV